MITKIKSIKDFGVLKNFNGSTVPEFKIFNLIYGWNYSGKTTFSRVFRCLEKGKLHSDYLNATFELAHTTGNYNQAFITKPNIRVFNSDFIKENLQWDADSIDPIFLLSEENIELQKELKEKEQTLIELGKELENLIKSNEANEKALNASLTNKAREISLFLSLGRTFDRDKLKALIESIKDNLDDYILDKAKFDEYHLQALSTEEKPKIDEIIYSLLDFTKIINEVTELLQKQATSEEKIQKLLNDKILSDWVEKGKNLHIEKTECEFCGNKLPPTLLESLNKHFSRDFDLLKTSIDKQIQHLTSLKVKYPLPAETAFYADIQPKWKEIKLILEESITQYNLCLDSLIKDLENKKEKPFDKLEVTVFVDCSKDLEHHLITANEIIKQNNKRTLGFSSNKDTAKEIIKKHLVADFERTEQSLTIQANSKQELQSIKNKQDDINKQQDNIKNIKSQLDETVKGAEKINEYLAIFFGKDDIKIEPTSDKKFQLSRGGEIAKNLSEGEKTAIAFAYFITKLEEQNNKIKDTIIYIDDPISSLDSNHLFNIYAFIKNTFYEFKYNPATSKKEHTPKCKQLFISTHNFEFYNLVYDWFYKTKLTMYSLYIIERSKNSHKDESTLKESNHLIEKYNSEYAYLFSIIYNFNQSPTEENLYHLPNIMRRFIETYLNFKFLSKNFDENIIQLITNPIECERARKFMHYYSHGLTTDKFIKFADLSESTAVVQIIIESIKNDDSVHFNSLVQTVTS